MRVNENKWETGEEDEGDLLYLSRPCETMLDSHSRRIQVVGLNNCEPVFLVDAGVCSLQLSKKQQEVHLPPLFFGVRKILMTVLKVKLRFCGVGWGIGGDC